MTSPQRPGSVLLAALLALPGCERRTVTSEAPVHSADNAPDDRAELRKWFDEAEACPDRYDCPPLAKLQERAERPGELRVLEVAFDIMADPKVQTFERRFAIASQAARAWAAARTTEGRTLSSDDERALRASVVRLLARTDNVVPAHSFVQYLSDAREILEREVLDLRRGNDEVHSAIRSLRDREPDLTTVRTWLAATEERPLIGGALLLDALDHDRIRRDDEVAMLVEFARRGDTAPEAARIIAQHAADHADPAFTPVLRELEHHPDASVRDLASQALKTAQPG